MVDFLGPLGFEVYQADNGEAALTQAEAVLPDVILMDIVMPVMDGVEVMRRLRQLPRVENVPIIAVSEIRKALLRRHSAVASAVS